MTTPKPQHQPAQRLRQLLNQPGLITMPCCYDALTSRLIHEAGFPLTLMSGFAVAAARLAQPDTGLISFAEMLDQLRNICAAASGLCVIGDGDTGYGNAINVRRTVREYALAGAAAIMIEDQVSPKRCGHTRGKQVVARGEAKMRIRAAVDERGESNVKDILIMARTDARAVHGFDEALERCRMFVDEGADIIFLEAPESRDEMEGFCRAIARPCMANMVSGGATPVLPPRELEALGYKIAAYPLVLISTAVRAMQQALGALARGETSDAVSFDELKRLVGFPEYYEIEQRYRTDN
jgi:2-methylisocitrate lyase-like PEP mutase family enzyme